MILRACRSSVIPGLSRWGPVVIWMAVIFALSSQPSFPLRLDDPMDFLLRKLAHLGEYAVLAALLCRALPPGGSASPARTALWAVAIASAYALTDEAHQALVPQRGGSITDVGIDLIGAVAGAASWRAVTHGTGC